MNLKNGYKRKAEEEPFRLMTVEEAKLLTVGQTVPFCTEGAVYKNVKINGAPKTWVTRPDDVDIPVKYGLYEYSTLFIRGGEWRSKAKLLVREEVTQQQQPSTIEKIQQIMEEE